MLQPLLPIRNAPQRFVVGVLVLVMATLPREVVGVAPELEVMVAVKVVPFIEGHWMMGEAMAVAVGVDAGFVGDFLVFGPGAALP